MKKQEFILNGSKIRSLKQFYNEIEKELILNPNAITYWSLDILDDIFLGGYGLYNLEEDITIRWVKFRISEKKLEAKVLTDILHVFQSHKHIELILE